jgi:hypothetical protein
MAGGSSVTTTTQRPEWRDVNVALLADRLRNTYNNRPPNSDVWNLVAEAAVDELIDRPEREFQKQLDAVLTSSGPTRHVGTWSPATVDDWLPEHA